MSGIEDPSRLADSIAAHLSVRMADKQKVLETADVGQRLELLIGLVDGEMDLQQVEKRIRGRVKSQMEKSQREYYLNEQMKAIQKELGEGEDGPNEVEELQRKIDTAGMPKPVLAKARQEFSKLKQMSPMSAEATVVRNYLDWLVGVPWKKRSKVRKDLQLAQEVLDADHFGLEKVKERILEYLAVQQRVNTMKGPILCLVGPPGVGKTSLGQSIAKATNRKFVRMSLGGVRDEAEIRGHRRTYIGSMPGRIVQNLNKVGAKNPLFVLDEIDKMSMDFRGDPSSALLEVLDPEQNHAFNDHYLEVDLDLSEVMWIATANSLNIPGPLLDRMEVIRIPGYTEDEKLAIAQRYLLPKQLKANGLKPEELSVDEEAVRDIVRYYTRESGVRNLEREISKICRKVVKELTLGEVAKAKAAGKRGGDSQGQGKAKAPAGVKVTSENLEHYLGVRRFDFGRKELQNEVGLVTGLAWTQVGGDLLSIEASVVPGKGRLVHTGQLGDVMKESIQAALVGGARACGSAGHRSGVPPEARCAYPCAGRRHAQGWPQRGYRHVHGAGVGADAGAGALRSGDDRRDHLAWPRAADRRPEGKAAGGASRWHHHGDHSRRKQEGSGGYPGQHHHVAGDPSGALDRRGARYRTGAAAAARPHRKGGDIGKVEVKPEDPAGSPSRTH